VVDFKLPTSPNGNKWEVVLDTAGKGKKINGNGTYSLEAFSYVLLKSPRVQQQNEHMHNLMVTKKVLER
jgi:hypothetical protein